MAISRRFRLTSIPGLAIWAFALGTLPLVAALVTATVYVNRVTAQGQQSVQRATGVANASQQLAESLIAMERNARQYNILVDRALFRVYLDRRKEFLEAQRQLSNYRVSEQTRRHLRQIASLEERLHQQLRSVPPGSEEAANVLGRFGTLTSHTKFVQGQSKGLINQAIIELQHSAERAKNLMVWQLGALIPVVLLVTALFFYLIVKPIRHLDAAIRRLGRGELDTEIMVKGPKDLEELGDRLNWMRTRIKELENQKVMFLRHMSHELKTPLTSIREGSELLSEEIIGSLNPEQAEVAQLLQHNCLRLQQQIEDLLNFSIAQTHQLTLNLTTFRGDLLINAVLQDHQLAMKSKELDLVKDLEEVPLTADREKVHTIIDNLLSNAVKYSPAKGRLSIRLAREADHALIEVRDNGPGIPADEKDKIFDAFYQGTIQNHSAIKGTGLGLSIALAYVQLHNGEIYVGKCDNGAELCVKLPLSPPTQ